MFFLSAFSFAANIHPRLGSVALPLAQAADDLNNFQPQNPVAGAIGGLIGLLIALVAVVSLWKIFSKAGQPGWAAIVPFYNAYTLCKVAGKPGWWLILFFVPFVNFIILILVGIGVAERFGKSAGFGVGIALLGIVFLPILAFGDARYQGAPPLPSTLG